MRYKALASKLLDIGITIDNEDTYLADINRAAFFNEDLVTVVIGRLHTVAADGDNKVGLLCFCTFGHEQFFGKIAVKEVSGTRGCRERVVIHLQHTGLGLPRKCCHTFIFAVDHIINDLFTVLVKGSVFLYGVPFGSRRTVSHRLTSDQFVGGYTNGNVKSVRFLNDDAKEVLGEVSLKGQSLKNAVAFTIAAYKTGGYMDKNDTVLISFDKKLSENGELRATVAEDVRQALKDASSVHTLVYVSETDDANTAELAKKYNISQGKAKLVGDAAENSELSVDEIVKLPLDELVGLQKEVDSVVIDSKYIGMTKAKAIALNDAGCEFRVEFTEATLIDVGVRTPYYRLVFRDKNTQWTYHINAINGDIIEKNATVMFISLEEAREIAFKDAGIDGSEKVVFTKEELNRNQGRPCWVLEFCTSKFEYVYKIDAKTGEIIYFDYHIDIRRAKGIAMTDAGCGDKVMFTVEKLVSGGIKTPYYHFVFNDGRTQWTYRIDATLGIVLEKSKASLIKAS